MRYHKIGNEWVKYQHNLYRDDVENCLKTQPELVCTEVKRLQSKLLGEVNTYWRVGWLNGGLTIQQSLFNNSYDISWIRKIRHLHFENQTKIVNGQIIRSLYMGCAEQEVILKTESKFANAVQEALNLYVWLKDDLKIIDEQFFCFDEKSNCNERYISRIKINEIDLSLHKINFKEGLQEVLVA